MLRCLSLVLLTVFAGFSGWARPLSHMPVLVMPSSDYDSGANSQKDFNKRVLPKSLTAADSSQSVVAKIIDNSLSYWWENSEMKNSSIGQTATKIEENMKAEVDLGASGSASDKTDHKLSLKFLAMQALAKIQYIGWTRAEINYDAKASKAEVEVLENLSNNKDLVITHSFTASESKSQLSLRWNW